MFSDFSRPLPAAAQRQQKPLPRREDGWQTNTAGYKPERRGSGWKKGSPGRVTSTRQIQQRTRDRLRGWSAAGPVRPRMPADESSRSARPGQTEAQSSSLTFGQPAAIQRLTVSIDQRRNRPMRTDAGMSPRFSMLIRWFRLHFSRRANSTSLTTSASSFVDTKALQSGKSVRQLVPCCKASLLQHDSG